MDLNDLNWRDISADWDCGPAAVLKGVLTLPAGSVSYDFHAYAIAVERSEDEDMIKCVQVCEACGALDDLVNLAEPDGPFERVSLRDWPHEYVIYMYPFVE